MTIRPDERPGAEHGHVADGGAAEGRCEPLKLDPLPFALLDAPLDYMLADHFRLRTLCVALKRSAERGRVSRAEADLMIGFFDRDMPLHHEDEDETLFPLLRRRALPEDELGVVLARLGADHDAAAAMARDIIAGLSVDLAAGEIRLPAALRDVMRGYVANEHRHLAIENGIVLALARVRLTRSDLRRVSTEMKARRGA
jgi:hemerythrin-like domain-containing protein